MGVTLLPWCNRAESQIDLQLAFVLLVVQVCLLSLGELF